MHHDYPRITVTWADHFIDYGEHKLEDVLETVKDPFIGQYSGFLVAESKRMIAIASNIWEDGTISDPMFIMKKSIVDREYD